MQVPESSATLSILIAEDDEGHAELIREHLQETGLDNPILRFRDGQEVLDWFAAAPAGPCVLLLDINMPRVDGMEVLRRLKGDPRTRNVPVIMLTTTDDPREVDSCYRLGCNFYIAKPMAFGAFAETMRRLGQFLQILQVPRP